MISPDDILSFLVGRTASPSSFGAQLDRLRFGTSSKPDPHKARSEAENQILEQATLLRCMDKFATCQVLKGPMSQPLPTLDKLSKQTRLPHGALALAILQAYQERSTVSKERGFVEVYLALRRIAPTFGPTPPDNAPDLLQAFRSDEARRCRAYAASALADALLGLSTFVNSWNRKQHE